MCLDCKNQKHNTGIRISVVVPVFNMEKYIEECINSILDQNYSEEYELVLVNDGSTDASLEICLKYKNKYRQITVLSFMNEGVISARMHGAQAAKGEYILNVDSDDKIEVNTLKELHRIIEENNPDAVFFNLQSFGADSNYVQKNHLAEGLYLKSRMELIRDGYLYSNKVPGLNYGVILPSAGGKLIKRNIYIDSLANVPKSIFHGEDLIQNFFVIKECDSIYLWNSSSYLYRTRSTSVTNNVSIGYIDNALDLHSFLIEAFPDNNNQICVNTINRLWNITSHLAKMGTPTSMIRSRLTTNGYSRIKKDLSRARIYKCGFVDRIKISCVSHGLWSLWGFALTLKK